MDDCRAGYWRPFYVAIENAMAIYETRHKFAAVAMANFLVLSQANRAGSGPNTPQAGGISA